MNHNHGKFHLYRPIDPLTENDVITSEHRPGRSLLHPEGSTAGPKLPPWALAPLKVGCWFKRSPAAREDMGHTRRTELT